MAHIDLNETLPGIRGLMDFSPATAKPLNNLAEALLRGENSLDCGERELIATYVSYLNDCFFCQNAHGGIAQHYMGCNLQFLDNIKENPEISTLSDKIKALLALAKAVWKGGGNVSEMVVDRARKAGADDMEIHDTVLIAAAFCMFNRYVDGLDTKAPQDRQFYVDRGPRRAVEGYAHFDPRKG